MLAILLSLSVFPDPPEIEKLDFNSASLQQRFAKDKEYLADQADARRARIYQLQQSTEGEIKNFESLLKEMKENYGRLSYSQTRTLATWDREKQKAAEAKLNAIARDIRTQIAMTKMPHLRKEPPPPPARIESVQEAHDRLQVALASPPRKWPVRDYTLGDAKATIAALDDSIADWNKSRDSGPVYDALFALNKERERIDAIWKDMPKAKPSAIERRKP